ncbi:MAG: nicotinamide riboside transporter PnuC [Methanosarcinales archaeon]|jgi:nicotinamide mononucleotide transporter|nr:nicotinamide riboside transporter PnuC [Methanosarcinales archaeon]
MNFLDINTIMIEIGNYPLSYIEFLGTVLYFISVFLISRKNILTWPVGILSVILYFILFYQIQLYADMLEQVYYFVISICGWIFWHKKREEQAEKKIETSWGSSKQIALTAAATIILTCILTVCISNFHVWLPAIFTEQASFPFLDALTTIMSFTAMYLTTIKKNEGWIYWIIVDVIAIGLYWVKDVKFMSVQYVILLGMAIYGMFIWMRGYTSGKK